MIPQSINETQGIITEVFESVPVILHDSREKLYLLVKDLNHELEDFILTGKVNDDRNFHVLSHEQEQEMVSKWESLGLSVTYHNQQIDYMHQHVTITFLQVSNQLSDKKIVLMPWWMLPGRPFPIFIYVYAIWHYRVTDGKSLRLSAEATGKLFGISINRSTICRNIEVMENLLETFNLDEPLPIEYKDMSSAQEVNDIVPQILRCGVTFESLREAHGAKIRHLPAPINRKKIVTVAYENIPQDYSNVIKAKDISERKSPDTRKRPVSSRKKQPVQQKPDFVESQQIEYIRKGFIAICRGFVLNAAIKYHKFLL